jgi:hypothetical protein
LLSRAFSFTASVAGDSVVVAITNATGGFSTTQACRRLLFITRCGARLGLRDLLQDLQHDLSATCNVTLDLRTDNDVSVGTAAIAIGAVTRQRREIRPNRPEHRQRSDRARFLQPRLPAGSCSDRRLLGFFGATTSVLPIKIVGARETQH